MRSYLNRYFPGRTEVVGVAERQASAEKLMQEVEADLMLLDIDLTDGTGFDVLAGLDAEKREAMQVIIISSLEGREHVKRAMDMGTIGFLDKPVVGEDFVRVLEKAISLIEKHRGIKQQLESIPSARRALPKKQTGTIMLRKREGNTVLQKEINVSDVEYARAARVYCDFVTTDGNTHVQSLPLKHYEALLLKQGFVRIGRGYLVNPLRVRFEQEGGTKVLYAVTGKGERIEVGKSYRESVLGLL